MSIEISDVRQAYLKWNDKSLEQLLQEYEPAQQAALRVIPLLLQLNHRLLPGYAGPNTPSGIYGYQPSRKVLETARQINNRFSYEQQAPLKNTIIESVFLQRGVIDGQLSLWVIHGDNIKADRLTDLNDKLHRMAYWLKNRGLEMTSRLSTAEKFCSNLMRQYLGKMKSCDLALDHFYYESLLLAGKYPVWWLVPPDRESAYGDFVAHIRNARFVNDNEYIDLGGLKAAHPVDIVNAAAKQIYGIYHRPDMVWLSLLLLDVRQQSLPRPDGLALRFKHLLYQAIGRERQADRSRVLISMLKDALDAYADAQHVSPLNKILQRIERQSHPAVRWIFRRLLPQKTEQLLMPRAESLDMVRHLNLYKALLAEVRMVFDKLLSRFDANLVDEDDNKLSASLHRISLFLSDSETRVPLYNLNYRPELVLQRMVIRHEGRQSDRDYWSLVTKDDEDHEKTVQGFNSLLALLCWSWLNRIVDQGTQVSLHCPMRLVRQIEARHVLEILMSRINPVSLINTPKEAFKKDAQAVSSLLFFSVLVDEDIRKKIEAIPDLDDPLDYIEDPSDLVTHCEQLIINTWGDVYVRHYQGNEGMLQCLCDWMNTAPATVLNDPETLSAHGYASGISTFMAQRLTQIYQELREFIARHKRMDCRFIASLGHDYYCLEADEGKWQVQHIGMTEAALYAFLEQSRTQFKPLGMDRLVLATTPLKDIAAKNRPDVFQVFFHVTARQCDTWVWDDRGSLFHYRHAWFDRNSYLAHWLYLIRNIRNRLKKISHQKRELPMLEIQQVGFSRSGGYAFYPVGSDTINMERHFIDVQVSVVTEEEGDMLSLICDGQHFAYERYQNNVVNECVACIKQRIQDEDRLPIYVTDVQAPLRLFGVERREDIQLVHFLKYKRNIENRLNQLVYGV